MLLSRMKKADDGFYCSSCSKVVRDFRSMSNEEIKESFIPGSCGIFAPGQLKHQKKYKPLYRIAFSLLTFFSFVGFSVRPLQAQTSQTDETNKNIPNIELSHISRVETKEHGWLWHKFNSLKNSRLNIFRRRDHIMGIRYYVPLDD